MRSRWAIVAAALFIACISTGPAFAGPRHVLAQPAGGSGATEDQKAGQGDDSTSQGDTSDSSDSGQSDPKAETGSSKKQTSTETPEAGPPWTYQMARIIVVLSILLGLAIFRWYWKLVGSRQRAA